MDGWMRLELLALKNTILHIYGYILPEFPEAGLIVAVLSVLFFVFYLFKSGFVPAFKTALTVLAVLTIVLYVLHHLAKLFGFGI